MKKIYFIGINGIGMSGLAKIMKTKRYSVKGSDLTRSYVTDEMESMGIRIYGAHVGSQVKGSDMVIASSAIKYDNPEYAYAREQGIRIMKRGELLAMLLNDETGVAIAGTHGKTTTTSMMSSVMLNLDPTIVVGGILPEIGSNAKTGASEYFVAEADESDNSFLYMYPKYSVITNIEEDHMENHGSLSNIIKSFSVFLDQTKIEAVVCADNPNVREIVAMKKRISQRSPVLVTYGIGDRDYDIFASDIRVEGRSTTYEVFLRGGSLGRFALSIPGAHNVSNSLPVIYLAGKFGVPMEEIREKLRAFKGSRRRYDVVYENENSGIRIIDDYAHHPTEIRATLDGARSVEKGDITVIFQPHRYSRVKFLLRQFKDVFDKAGEVILLPIYSAGERDEFGVTLEDLRDAIGHPNVRIEKDSARIKDMILNSGGKRVWLFMGAGDISKIARDAGDALRAREGGV
ncbi:MAG: UDP-N-acetylmuramate--L-alanine ligase [Fusobacteriaceae bacterium]|jgi:UDP-N-acetylmuramate--alanine ligase|nr:UDP-N-acetylmuramate--L-alanine ligase [Fusobacteriaceae bacterium]